MSASPGQSGREWYEFGPFRIDPEKQVVLRGGEPVPLTPKTFQILLVLIRHKKEIVTKDDLMKTVWPDTFVEESNLTRSVFMLRKALSESAQDHRYIVTVPGQGYRFAEDVRLVPEHELSIVAARHSRVHIEVEEGSSWLRSIGAIARKRTTAAAVGIGIAGFCEPVAASGTVDLNILRTPKNAQHTPKQDLSRTFRANSLDVVSCRLRVSRMNPNDPNRQKTAARKTNNELFGRLLQNAVLPVQFLQFIL